MNIGKRLYQENTRHGYTTPLLTVCKQILEHDHLPLIGFSYSVLLRYLSSRRITTRPEENQITISGLRLVAAISFFLSTVFTILVCFLRTSCTSSLFFTLCQILSMILLLFLACLLQHFPQYLHASGATLTLEQFSWLITSCPS